MTAQYIRLSVMSCGQNDIQERGIMLISKFLRRLSYWSLGRQVIRILHLHNIFRKWYYYWSRPRNGILTIEVRGISAQFYIHTPGELRVLESMGGGGCGERHILELLISKLRAGDVIYDIGSHVGLYTIVLAKVVGPQGQVIAFEPESQNHKHLLSNVELNDLMNVRVFRKALGDQDSEKKLYIGDDTGNSSLVRPYATETSYELVELVNGDRFVEAENLPLPRVVKIDVEGYEYNVIEGLRHTLGQPACELVCCEIHPTLLPAEVKPEIVLELLKSLGFGHINLYIRESEYHAVAYKAVA